MRITARGIGGIAAIAVATAFAGCQCSVGSVPPPAPPPPPPPAAAAPAAPVAPQNASAAHPPALAPLPASMREKLEKHDGGT